MSFKELYQSKKMDADQALNLIRSGDRVVVGHACAEPSYLLDVLTEKAEQYENCLLYTSPSPRDGLLSRMPSSA